MSGPILPGDREGAFAAALLDARRPAPEGLREVGGRPPSRRFRIHRDSLAGGLVRALAARFPVVERVVGEAFFAAMARGFALRHPPASALMLRYGEAFPAFIRGFRPAAGLPYLADLARLEDARSRAYHAADAAPLGPAAFAALDPGGLAGLRIGLHPAVQVVRSRHPVVTLWAMHQPGDAPEPVTSWRGEDALVTRPALAMEVHALPAGMAGFLLALRRGAPLGAAATIATRAAAEFDLAAGLASIVSLGLTATLHPDSMEHDR